VVVRPGYLDINLARALLKLATQIDDDPLVDFAYGFITGDMLETALALAEAGSMAEQSVVRYDRPSGIPSQTQIPATHTSHNAKRNLP
jgi:hypothetical protein